MGMERRLCFESHMDIALWAFSDKVKRKDFYPLMSKSWLSSIGPKELMLTPT